MKEELHPEAQLVQPAVDLRHRVREGKGMETLMLFKLI